MTERTGDNLSEENQQDQTLHVLARIFGAELEQIVQKGQSFWEGKKDQIVWPEKALNLLPQLAMLARLIARIGSGVLVPNEPIMTLPLGLEKEYAVEWENIVKDSAGFAGHGVIAIPLEKATSTPDDTFYQFGVAFGIPNDSDFGKDPLAGSPITLDHGLIFLINYSASEPDARLHIASFKIPTGIVSLPNEGKKEDISTKITLESFHSMLGKRELMAPLISLHSKAIPMPQRRR